MAGYISGPYNKAFLKGKIPAGQETARHVALIMSVLGKLDEMRGHMGSDLGEIYLAYIAASPKERDAFRQKLPK